MPAPTQEHRWDPIGSFRHEMDRLFDDLDFSPLSWTRPMRSPRLAGALDRVQNWVLSPAIDMSETEGGYRLTAELPGMEAGDIQVTVANGTLTISGEKKEESGDKKPGYVVNERRYGAFRRSFRLAGEIDPEGIAAEFSKGILTLTLPRSARAKAEQRTIEVKSA